jgi:hypothetical protein
MNLMKYRDIEYTVVQGIERQMWKWSVSVADMVVRGQAATRARPWQTPSARLTGRLLLKSGDLSGQTSRAANKIGEAVALPPMDEAQHFIKIMRGVRCMDRLP